MVPKVINNLFWHLGWWSTFNKWLEAICQFFVSQNNGFFPASKLKVRINDFLPSLFLPFLSHGFKVLVAFAFKNHLWDVKHSWVTWQTYLSEVILYWKCMRVFKMHNLHFKVMCTCHQVFIVELHIIYNTVKIKVSSISGLICFWNWMTEPASKNIGVNLIFEFHNFK